jgi:hypothetical protein
MPDVDLAVTFGFCCVDVHAGYIISHLYYPVKKIINHFAGYTIFSDFGSLFFDFRTLTVFLVEFWGEDPLYSEVVHKLSLRRRDGFRAVSWTPWDVASPQRTPRFNPHGCVFTSLVAQNCP